MAAEKRSLHTLVEVVDLLSQAAVQVSERLERVGDVVDGMGGVVDRFGYAAALKLMLRQSARPALRSGTSVVCTWSEGLPLARPRAAIEIQCGAVVEAEYPQVVALLNEAHWPNPEGELQKRMAEGHRCFAARSDGKIVTQTWVSRAPHNVEELWDMRLNPDEARIYDSYTSASHRGQKILPALLGEVLATLVEEGVRHVHTSIGGDNVSSLRVASMIFPIQKSYPYMMARTMRMPRVMGMAQSQCPRLEAIERPFDGINVTNLVVPRGERSKRSGSSAGR